MLVTPRAPTTPAVSVIVPTYQRREPLLRAVESVLFQLFRDFELIVVDDGSTDGTAEALGAYGERVRLVRQPNRGAAAARNAGLAIARGDLVAFLDSDNRWLAEHLAVVVDALAEHPEAVLAFSSSSRSPISGPVQLIEPLPRLLVGNFVGLLSAVAARRDALAAACGFDERLRVTEDADLWLRLALNGGSFAFVPRRTLVRAVSDDSLLASRRQGEYADSLELSATKALEQLAGGGGDPAAAWLKGRLHLVHALRSLRRRDDQALRSELAAACRLLPGLSSNDYSMLSHLRFNLGHDDGRLEQARQLAAAARAWPDPHSEAGRALRAHARSAGFRFRDGRRIAGVSRRVQSVMVRTERGPLRPLWALLYEVIARVVARRLRGGEPGVSAYVRGSLGDGDPVYGLSDIDLAYVVDAREDVDEARERVGRRWRRLRKRMPAPAAGLIDPPEVFSETELQTLASSTPLSDGCSPGKLEPSSRERHRERAGAERSLFNGLPADWRLVGGPERRPPIPGHDADVRLVSSWIELQYWWLQGFKACAEPEAAGTPYLCAKLMTEPARVWLWLEHGERIVDRRALIRRALSELPEEEEPLRAALALLDSVGRPQEAPLQAALDSCARMTGKVAQRVTAEAEQAGATAVRLVGRSDELSTPPASRAVLRRTLGDAESLAILPLLDWRARVWSLFPDECFAPAQASRLDPALLGAAAIACNQGAYAALRLDDLLVLPSLKRARLRGVQCAVTDPVSFALMDALPSADFPDVPGWSARDSARRAVSEHLGWLGAGRPGADGAEELARLFGAARAALFLESLDGDDPWLALTPAAVAAVLGDAVAGSGSLALEACAAHRAGRRAEEQPREDLVAALRGVVTALPLYERVGMRRR